MNNLNDPEADAVHDRHAAEREQLAELRHRPGPPRVTGRVRGIWRFMTEPVLIAAAALTGALIGAYYHPGYGSHPITGTAGAMSGLASGVGLVMFLWRSHRAGTRATGGMAIRFAVMLLCVDVDLYGHACVCDDVSQAVYLPAITVE